jgi:carbonic anhydrase
MLGAGLRAAGLAAAASVLPLGAVRADEADAIVPRPNAIPPDAALQRLVEGNARHAANLSTNRDPSAGRISRASAQYPFAAIVSCADSRVVPEFAFDQGPGELFVVRVAGNVVDDDGLATLEYGVKALGVPFIMVLGHSGCGAVAATIKVVKEGVTLPGHLPGLAAAIRPAVETAIGEHPDDLLAAATRENVKQVLKRLGEASPLIAGFLSDGGVKTAGGVYDIATGKVALL